MLQLEQSTSRTLWISDEGMISLRMDADDRVADKSFLLVAPAQETILERIKRAVGL